MNLDLKNQRVCWTLAALLAILLSLSNPLPTLAQQSASAVTRNIPSTPPKDAPDIDTILASLQDRFADVKDIVGVVDLQQFSADGSIVNGQTRVQACLPNLLRLSFVKPETFAGTLYVLDRKTNQVMQYSPITDQVMVSSIDQVLSERFVPTTVEQLFSLPSTDDYDLAVFDTEKNGKQKLVGVWAQAKEDSQAPFFHFWIDEGSWIIARMHVFDAQGQRLFTMVLRDVETNQNLREAQLRRMPPGAVTVYR